MKDKHSSEVIYALADYKQLVLAYRTKHAELVKSLTFWKTSVIWLSVLTILIVFSMMFWMLETGRNIESNKKSEETLSVKVNAITEKLSRAEDELALTRDELARKEELIKLLEKNISTTSKNLVEKLLTEQEEPATAK
jgi:hypothetical protein